MRIIITTIIVSLTVLLGACQKEDVGIKKETTDVRLAKVNLLEFKKMVSSQAGQLNLHSSKISKIEQLTNEGVPIDIFCVSFEKGGYQLISADKRAPFSLAYVPIGEFSIDDSEKNLGFKLWMGELQQNVNSLNQKNHPFYTESKNAWDKAFSSQLGVEPKGVLLHDNDEALSPQRLSINTTWSQIWAYNDSLSPNSCSRQGSNDNVPAGCNIVAFAQVMKYLHESTDYLEANWNLMPASINNASPHWQKRHIQQLYKKLWDFYPPYIINCSGTGHNDYLIYSTFKPIYPSIKQSSYDYDKLKTSIDNDCPVILTGRQSYTSTNGHTWVCEGYNNLGSQNVDGDLIELYMNWGWAGIDNGWYTSWAPAGQNWSFNSRKTMFYGFQVRKFPLNTRTVGLQHPVSGKFTSSNGFVNATAFNTYSKFEFKHNTDGTYSIKSRNGKWAYVNNDGLITFNSNYTYSSRTKFIITRYQNDLYRLKSKYNRKYLGVKSSSSWQLNKKLECSSSVANDAHKWTIKVFSASSTGGGSQM